MTVFAAHRRVSWLAERLAASVGLATIIGFNTLWASRYLTVPQGGLPTTFRPAHAFIGLDCALQSRRRRSRADASPGGARRV